MGKKKRKKQHLDKKKVEKRTGSKLKLLLVIIVLVFLGFYLFSGSRGSDRWSLSKEGFIEYPQRRGKPVYTLSVLDEGDGYMLKKAVFESKGEEIYSLIYLPYREEPVPGIVFAPGAGPTKESRIELARFLADLGFASIILDQRTFGETGGSVASFDQDIVSMGQGLEPDQHKMVFDILVALDVLGDQKEVDSSRIILIGESMGGRFSIIAAALDPVINGVIGISTGGYGTRGSMSPRLTPGQINFLRSIDPDSYIGRISPRRVVMLHLEDDEVVPLQVALDTYGQAGEPKKFFRLPGGGHGYYPEQDSILEEELRNWVW